MMANPFEDDLLSCQVRACRVSVTPWLFPGRGPNVFGDGIIIGVDFEFLSRLLPTNRWD